MGEVVIFVDSNVFIYAVGRAHPLRTEAQQFFLKSRNKAEVTVCLTRSALHCINKEIL